MIVPAAVEETATPGLFSQKDKPKLLTQKQLNLVQRSLLEFEAFFYNDGEGLERKVIEIKDYNFTRLALNYAAMATADVIAIRVKLEPSVRGKEKKKR